MKNIRNEVTDAVWNVLSEMAQEKGIDPGKKGDLISETPPKTELGDIAYPLFPFAKQFKDAPARLAAQAAKKLSETFNVRAAGPYLNIFLDRRNSGVAVIGEILALGDQYGKNTSLKGERIAIEFSSPNTNKPLHLGHLRNDALGESLSRILKMSSADVVKLTLINDRGVHICKSMAAYKAFSNGSTPESEGRKSDHFVGDCYVRFNKWSQEDSDANKEAQAMLVKWESGDTEIMELWRMMRKWAINGMEETYRATEISFDKRYAESETYLLGKEIVEEGITAKVFKESEDGSVFIDLSPIGLDTKVVRRSDGTSVYITQDLGTAISRHKDMDFDRMIYIVGSEQDYHFKVLFFILKELGYPWADRLHHLSYGMVNLPEGKMKSREGTVVDADDLLDNLSQIARDEIAAKERLDVIEDVDETSRKVALGALHCYLLQFTPSKDILFKPKESLSFNGNTGPYLQYACARITSLLEKACENGLKDVLTREAYSVCESLCEDQEWDVVKLIASFPEIVEECGVNLNPSPLVNLLLEVARAFSRLYHDLPILACEDPALRNARLLLAKATLQTLKNGLNLIVIPFLERM